MADPTAGGGTEGLREAIACCLAQRDGWMDPYAPFTDNMGIIAAGGKGDPVWLDYVEDADALLAGPLARASAEQAKVEAERAGLRTALVALSRVVDEDRLKADTPAQAAFDLALKLPEAPDVL